MINIISDLSDEEQDKELQGEYFKWIQRKQNSLLHALEKSKEQALLKELYWLDGAS